MRPALAFLLLSAFVTGANAADVKGASRIDAVLVFPSGAEVTRIGKVRLAAGDHVVLFTDLPARAIGSSIRVEGKASAKLEIGSVDSRRTFVPRSDDAVAATERKRIEDAIEKLKDDRAVLQAAVQAAEAQKTLIGNLAQLPNHPAPGNGPAPPQPDWTQIFAIIGQRFAEAQKAVLETQVKMREVDRQIKDLEGKLASLAPAQDERTEVKIFVNAAAALEAEIAIRYQVGAASWLPFYDARLATGTKAEAPKLQLVRRASIQQRSGESWENVALALSTTRPGAGTAAPELQPVTVDYEPDPQRPLPPAAGVPMPRSIARESAELPGGAEDARPATRAKSAPAPAPVQAEEVRAAVETQAFQAIYAIAGRVTVPATGEAKRVQIDEAQLEPALTVRTVPKRDQKAFLYVAGAGLAVPRRDFRGQRTPAAAGARRGARARLRRRRLGARASHRRGGEAGRDGHHHLIEDRDAQLSHQRQEPACPADPGQRHRPDSSVAERRYQDRAPGQDRADQARPRGQAWRAGLGHDAAARRGKGRRVRLSRHLARRQADHVRAGILAGLRRRERHPQLVALSPPRTHTKPLTTTSPFWRTGMSLASLAARSQASRLENLPRCIAEG
jgi:uncharacterized protein (TIGR02231 family)